MKNLGEEPTGGFYVDAYESASDYYAGGWGDDYVWVPDLGPGEAVEVILTVDWSGCGAVAVDLDGYTDDVDTDNNLALACG